MTTDANAVDSRQQSTQAKSKKSSSDEKVKLIAKMAEKFGVDANAFYETLKATAFRQRNGETPTNDQMMALLVVADQYGLNPFTREIYAFPDAKNNAIIPVVGVDGWLRIINGHPQYDGMEFRYCESTVKLDGMDKPIFEWIECVMYRKDRARPDIIREYLDEIYKPPYEANGQYGPYMVRGAWQTHTRRLARHKAIIQCARVAFGYSGIYDQDEAENILENLQQQQVSKAKSLNKPVKNNDSDLLNELNSTMFDGIEEAEFELVDTPLPDDALAVETRSLPRNAYMETTFGQINAKDVSMIKQMVDHATQTGAWKPTFESFNERYKDKTLEYALDSLQEAQQAATQAA